MRCLTFAPFAWRRVTLSGVMLCWRGLRSTHYIVLPRLTNYVAKIFRIYQNANPVDTIHIISPVLRAILAITIGGLSTLPYIQKGDIEDQGGEGLYRAGRAGAVTKVVRDDNLPAGTHRHLAEGSDPACDEFVEAESSGAAFLGLVEHLSVDELTYIMYCNETLWRRLGTVSL